MRKYFSCFLLIFMAMALPSAAGDLTLFGGFHKPNDITLTDIGGTFAQLTDPKDFGVFGARFNSSPAPIGLEHTFAYSPNFLDSDAFAILGNSNLIVGVPLAAVRPYGTVGVGFVFAGGEGPASVGAKLAINYGGGVKIDLTGPLGIRIDARRYSMYGFQSQTLAVFETSVGLLVRF